MTDPLAQDPNLLWTYVAANAAARGAETAVVAADRRISFAELADEAEALAASLFALGLRRGDVVSHQLPNWHEAIVVTLAVFRLGAVANPIVTIYRRHELRHIVADASPRMIFAPGVLRGVDHLALLDEVSAPNLGWIVPVRAEAPHRRSYAALVAAGRDLPPAPGTGGSADDPAVILYTSGTSGAPKGVIHSQRTLLSDARASIVFAGVGPEEVNLVASPITHVTGLSHAVFVPQLNATAVVLCEEWRPGAASRLIAAESCRWMAGATPFLDDLLHHPEVDPADLRSLRVFRCGGAGVPPGLVREAAARGLEVTRCYGCSEMPTISGISPGDPERNATTDGRIHDEVEVRVVALEDEARILEPGEVGEIQARGPELFLGYTDARQTQEAMTSDGWFRTGDIGRVDAAGFITIVGRRKDIIIRKGENISAREIEDLLATHPDIAQVAVIGLPDASRGEIVTAVCTLRRPGAGLSELRRFLEGAGLARQKWPERMEVVESLPMTAAGKVRKIELRERFADPSC